MIELFAISKIVEHMKTDLDSVEGFGFTKNTSHSVIILSFIIACGTSYIAYQCNSNENPATRFIIAIIAFMFSGVYLVYYFIRYIMLDGKCAGEGPSRLLTSVKQNIKKIKKIVKKK